MIGDFSRRYATELPNVRGILYQQGRVLLDADGNAQTDATATWQDLAARDAFGPGTIAVPAGEPDGFRVEQVRLAAGAVRALLTPGRAWVDGSLVRLTPPPLERRATYLQPPVQNPAGTETGIATGIAAGVRDALVLEVWDEAVSAFQEPDLLIEPALGGPDTAERLVTGMALRLLRLQPGDRCHNLQDKLDDDWGSKGRLTVSLQPVVPVAGDCPTEEGGGYTGFEHNLYRIEIAATTAPQRHFKWSQWNGGLVGRGAFDAATRLCHITANLAAITASELTNFYLETREFSADLGRWHVTYGAEVTLNGSDLQLPVNATFGAIPAPGTPVFFRLWNGIRPLAAFPVANPPAELADGIRLEFEADALGRYVPEDYWVFAVRAGGIANPQVLVNAQRPDGIHYRRAPLALLAWNAANAAVLSPDDGITDCREVFQPLTRLDDCCTFKVGDGVTSHGEYHSIQDALNHLPASGGKICVLPGVYREDVLIADRVNVTVSGCGRRSRLLSPGGVAPSALLRVRDSQAVRIENLAIEVDGYAAVRVASSGPGHEPARDVTLAGLALTAATRGAIEVSTCYGLVIRDCTLDMKDRATSWPALYCVAEDAAIEHNTIRVTVGVLPSSPGTRVEADAGFGGIQLGGTCARVRVADNLIQGGIGNGITLGTIILVDDQGQDKGEEFGWMINRDDKCAPCLPGDGQVPPDDPNGGVRQFSAGPLREILIERNRIYDMGLNGIGVVGFFDLDGTDQFITVDRLVITNNEIRYCLQRTLAPIAAAMVDSMGYGGIALADVTLLTVRDNVIEDNGPDAAEPVCGVFLLHGEGVDISGNRVVNNGARPEQGLRQLKDGRRSGIEIVYCVAPTVAVSADGAVVPVQNGVPALRVHDNVVSVPIGRALTVLALGPVSVQGNAFTSRGATPFTPSNVQTMAATVQIANLGLTLEALGTNVSAGALLAGQSAGPQLSYGNQESALPGREGLDDQVLRHYLGDGNVLFSDNQCRLNLLDDGSGLHLSSILIFGLDDVAFLDNQCDAALRGDALLTNLFVFGWSARACHNRFKETITQAALSAFTFGVMVTTADNHSTHCLKVKGGMEVERDNLVFLMSLVDNACGRFAEVGKTQLTIL